MTIFLWGIVGVLWTIICVAIGYMGGKQAAEEELDEKHTNESATNTYNSYNVMTPNEVRAIVDKNTPTPQPCNFTAKEEGDLTVLKQNVAALQDILADFRTEEVAHALDVVQAFESRMKRVERKTGMSV